MAYEQNLISGMLGLLTARRQSKAKIGPLFQFVYGVNTL
jgi:hypothetical protein